MGNKLIRQTMRKLYFLLPGLGGRYACGGLWAELKTLSIAQDICEATVVTYHQREPDTLFLADLLKHRHGAQQTLGQGICVLSWGFDVPKLAQKLRGYPLVYHAHSAGYGFRLPPHVPIVTVSRNTLGYWGQYAPTAPLYYLPNEISPEFKNHHQSRPIDVLVQTRKSSHYLLKQLIPQLQTQCRVEIVQGYVKDLPELFNQAKIYLYDSAEYWAVTGVTEGFGLQPLEALACGCQVFSSVNHGLSDYLDPGFIGYKIAAYSLDYDVQRILGMIENFKPLVLPQTLLQNHRRSAIHQRLTVILHDINEYFDYHKTSVSHHHFRPIAPLTFRRVWQLRTEQYWQKLKRLVLR
jgi:hypothetical protein